MYKDGKYWQAEGKNLTISRLITSRSSQFFWRQMKQKMPAFLGNWSTTQVCVCVTIPLFKAYRSMYFFDAGNTSPAYREVRVGYLWEIFERLLVLRRVVRKDRCSRHKEMPSSVAARTRTRI